MLKMNQAQGKEKRENRNNLFVSGRVNQEQENHTNANAPNQQTSVFAQIFGTSKSGNRNAPVPLTDSINQMQKVMNRNEASASASSSMKTGNMVNSILEVMNRNQTKLGQQMDRLNRNLQNPRKNTESVEELKSTIRKLYALLFSLYKLHTVPLEKRHAVLEEIKSKLQANHHFLNVVNRIVFENNNVRHGNSNKGNSGMNLGEVMKSVGMNMGMAEPKVPAPSPVAEIPASLEAIPTNHNQNQNQSGTQLLEEAKEEIPEIVLPEERIQEVIEEEQASENSSQPKPLNENMTEKVQNLAENTDLPASSSSSKKTNLSNRLHAILKSVSPMNQQVARQKLDAMDA